MKRILDEYINEGIGVTDLTYLDGSDSAAANDIEEPDNLICEFCNVALISKADDMEICKYVECAVGNYRPWT
jgi:hypothetical protein